MRRDDYVFKQLAIRAPWYVSCMCGEIEGEFKWTTFPERDECMFFEQTTLLSPGIFVVYVAKLKANKQDEENQVYCFSQNMRRDDRFQIV